MLCVPAYAGDLTAWLQARVDAVIPASAPVFIASYDVKPGGEAFDLANANSAYTYDESLVLLALLAARDVPRARRIGDALVFAQGHDRAFHDGRLRNAYASGVVADTPVKLPGYYDTAKKLWIEDSYQVGSATGNNAWGGLALMRLYAATNDRRYADAAHGIGRFLIDAVGAKGGFRGGFEGFEPHQQVLGWKSTEHNADALAFLRLLDKTYPGEGFGNGAQQAQNFIRSMWLGDHFATGTMPDGVTINAGYSSLDAQTFPILALLRPATGSPEGNSVLTKEQTVNAMAYLQRTHGMPGGLDYSDAREGTWPEGTAQAALVYRLTGDSKTAEALMAARQKDQGPGGGIYAVSGAERLQTKLKLGNGEGSYWYYYRRIHIAPVAWLIMAAKGYDPLSNL